MLIIGAVNWKSNAKSVWWLIIASIIFWSCGRRGKEAHEPEANYMVHGDTITLTEHSNIKSHLKGYTVEEQPFKNGLTTAGIVKTIANNYAAIAPPFAGRVTKSYVKLGQRVVQGSPIFEMSSSDYFAAQKEYFDTKQEFHQAEISLKRQQDLLKNGVGVQREMEEANTEFEIKKTAFSNASVALKIFDADPSDVALGKPLVIRSPIDGEIVENAIVIGQYLKEDSPPVAQVAELSKVWVAAQVKEKDIGRIKDMEEVEIRITSMPEKKITGEIHHISGIVDSETRSVQVLIECDNSNRMLKPGMYVTVLFEGASRQTLLVPTRAVFQTEKSQFVFVSVGKSSYKKREIETTGSSNGHLIVVSGLEAGEVIVNEGGIFLLKNQ